MSETGFNPLREFLPPLPAKQGQPAPPNLQVPMKREVPAKPLPSLPVKRPLNSKGKPKAGAKSCDSLKKKTCPRSPSRLYAAGPKKKMLELDPAQAYGYENLAKALRWEGYESLKPQGGPPVPIGKHAVLSEKETVGKSLADLAAEKGLYVKPSDKQRADAKKEAVFAWFALLQDPRNANREILLVLHPSGDQSTAERALEGAAELLYERDLRMDDLLLRVEDDDSDSYQCRVKDGWEECLANPKQPSRIQALKSGFISLFSTTKAPKQLPMKGKFRVLDDKGRDYQIQPRDMRLKMTPEQAAGYRAVQKLLEPGATFEPTAAALEASFVNKAQTKLTDPRALAPARGPDGWYVLLDSPHDRTKNIFIHILDQNKENVERILEGVAEFFLEYGVDLGKLNLRVRDRGGYRYECQLKGLKEVCTSRGV